MYLYTTEYYSTTKKGKRESFVEKGTYSETVMLSEVSQIHKLKCQLLLHEKTSVAKCKIKDMNTKKEINI